VGVLGTFALDPSPEGAAFREALRGFGWVEGQSLRLEYRFLDAGGSGTPLAELAGRLVADGAECLVAIGERSAAAARQATTSVPIVFVAVGDPVGSGLVASVSRPGGNATGLATLSPELSQKRLELLRQVQTRNAPVGVLWNPDNPGEALDQRSTAEAARTLGLSLYPIEARGPSEVRQALASAREAGVGALVVLTSRENMASGGMMGLGSRDINDFAIGSRLPVIFTGRRLVDDGGLMSYGPSGPDMFRRAAGYVDRSLRGARPSDLPVELPTTFELVINLKAAQAPGLTIPQSLIQQASEVVQ
jgi:putative ABC transport system substrate-binding protein